MKNNLSIKDNLRKRNKLGFSLVELVVAVSILAILSALFIPSLISYVETSRAQKDQSAMNELTDAIILGMTNQECYDELVEHCEPDNISCYIDKANESGYVKVITKDATPKTVGEYTFDDQSRLLDELKYYGAGNMSGITITFEPQPTSRNEKVYIVKDAVINKFIDTESEKAKLGDCEKLYKYVCNVVGDSITTNSQTYRNSDYTIFIAMQETVSSVIDPQDTIKIYGQYNGTNLSQPDTTPTLTADRLINGSQSPTPGGPSITPVIKEPGIYDSFGRLSITWNDLCNTGLIVENDGVIVSVDKYQLTGELVLPGDGSVKTIGKNAFETCQNLKHVTIQNGITKIEENAFSDCNDLISVTIGDDVEYIKDYAFNKCKNLKNVTFGKSLKSIGEFAFANCRSIGTLKIDNAQTIESWAFYECDGLFSVIIGDGVNVIGEGAFQKCTILNNVSFGVGITEITFNAFAECLEIVELNFKGTKEQWNQIDQDGMFGTIYLTVVCSNGNAIAG